MSGLPAREVQDSVGLVAGADPYALAGAVLHVARNSAPRADEGPENSPIPGRGLACWTVPPATPGVFAVEVLRGLAYSSLMPSLTASVWIMVLSLTLWAVNYFLFDDVLGAEETAVVVFLVALVVFAVRFFWERVSRRKGKA